MACIAEATEGYPGMNGHIPFETATIAEVLSEKDRSEVHDVGAQNPELLKELVALWHFQAGKYFGLPLEDRSAVAVLTTPRPQMSPPRNRYIYYPHTLEVPEAVAVNIRGRSYKIAAEVDLKKGEFKGMTTQLGKFALCGEGLNIGREGGAPVTFDYPGELPWAFTGGVLKRVIIDVSGEPYINFELEAMAMMSRD